MAVTVRAPFPAGTAGDIVAASTTITTSVTLLTGDDLELHCAYDKASDTGVTLSPKLDPSGANLSPDGSSTVVHSNGGSVGFEQVFWWLNASLSGAGLLGAGAKNLTVTASTSADSMEQKAYALTGADHNAPTITTASGSGTSAAVTSASCPSGGLAIGHFVGGSTFTATNNTNTLNQSGTSGNAGWNVAGNTAAGAGSTISLTGTLPSDFWAAIGSVWAPAGAAAPTGPPVKSQHWPTRLVGRWPLPQTLPLPPKVITPPPYFKDWSTNTTPDLIVSAEDWGLLANAGLNHSGDFAATYEDYFTTRQNQGYNGVEVSIFSYGTLSGGANGADSDGTFPFTPNTDPSGTANTTFWGRRDTFLTKAAAHGFRVFMNVTTPNIHNTPTSFTLGWTSTQWSNFGTFLGTRYASQSNIMWIVGDDYFDDIDSNLTTFLSALRAAGATQPISIQNYQEASSRRDIFDNSVRPWGNTNAQYNWGYSYNFWYDVVEKMGLEANPLPYMAADGFFLASGTTGLTDVQLIRRMIWWALSSGAKGFNIGDNDVWTWSSTALAQLTSKTIYTTVIPAIASYFRSLPNWHLLVADTSNVLVTSGRGTHGSAITSGGGGTPYTSNSDSYVTASRAVDGSLAVIYMSHASSITIDESQMVAGYKAYWVDPVTGSATLTTSSSSYSSSGLGNNSDGQADWVLVLRTPASGGGSQTFNAGLSFTSSQTRRTAKTLSAAALSFTSSLALRTAKTLTAAALSFTGSVTTAAVHHFTQALNASLSFTSSQTRRVGKAVSAGLSFTSSQVRQTGHGIAASLSFTSSQTKATTKGPIAAALSFTSSQTRRTAKTLTAAAVSFTGSVTTAAVHHFTQALNASLSFTGSLTTQAVHFFTQALNASVSFTSTQARQTAKGLSAAVSFTGSLPKRTGRVFSASMSFVTSQSLRTTRTVAAGLSFTGSVTTAAVHHFTQAFNASVSFTGSLTTQAVHFFTKALSASLSFTGSLSAGRIVVKALTASVSFTSSISRRTGKSLAAGVSFTGNQTKRIATKFVAALGLTGFLSRLSSAIPTFGTAKAARMSVPESTAATGDVPTSTPPPGDPSP